LRTGCTVNGTVSVCCVLWDTVLRTGCTVNGQSVRAVYDKLI